MIDFTSHSFRRDDPFGMMPPALPSHPRVFINAEDVRRMRRWLRGVDWLGRAVRRSVQLADAAPPLPGALPGALPVPIDRKLNQAVIQNVVRDALLHLIVGEPIFRERALAGMRLVARDYVKFPVIHGHARATGGSLDENKFNIRFARAYDLLEAGGLDDADRAMFRAALRETYPVMDAYPHRTCGNHNTWNLVSHFCVGAALGDTDRIYGALYGLPAPDRANSDTPSFRYGLIHQLRHDILPDGMHWERTTGYHFYTLMGFAEVAGVAANCGIDLWHRRFPCLPHSDGYDLHRSYRAGGEVGLKDMFDAPLYAAFTNGDLSLLHDSGLGNWRGIPIWGVLYHLAYDVYRDERYAWLIQRMDAQTRDRNHADLPVGLDFDYNELDFARIRTHPIPPGDFDLAQDAAIGVTGVHRRGSTLLPDTGQAILRSSALDPSSPGAAIFFGPHSAGHQNPAALHVDFNARGSTLTLAPHAEGYEDENYLNWCRTTIAQNTVTVDQRPMFPYDLDSDSIWEADSWRRRSSDGTIELFQSEAGFSAVRASNERVYPGVKLDRTLVLTSEYMLDVFRVFSDEVHVYDWAMHVLGEPVDEPASSPIHLGNGRGYRLLGRTRELSVTGQSVLSWRHKYGRTVAQLMPPEVVQGGNPAANPRVIMADDPRTRRTPCLGERQPAGVSSALIVRARAARCVFVSLWRAEAVDAPPTADQQVRLVEFKGDADHAIEATITRGAKRTVWHLPVQPAPVRRE